MNKLKEMPVKELTGTWLTPTLKERTETGDFYSDIQQKYEDLMRELIAKDCQRVEYLRGVLSVYAEILEIKRHWQPEKPTTSDYFK